MRPILNPLLRFKSRREREEGHRLTYRDIAEELDISEDLAKKLGCEAITSVSPRLAKHLETITEGRIKYLDVMRWVESHLGDGEAA